MSPTPTTPLTSIIVPTRNQVALLDTLTTSLIPTTRNHRIELLIVDNGSDQEAACGWLDNAEQRLRAEGFESVRVIRDPSPFNYSRLNNAAAASARGDFLCLMNDDIEVIDSGHWLRTLISHASHPLTGCVGAKLLYPDGTVQHAGVMLGMGRVAGHPFKGRDRHDPGPSDWLTKPRRVSAVTGACLLLRREVFEEINGFEEQLAIAWNDVDLCLRADIAGYRCIWAPDAMLYHHESVSRRSGSRRDPEARRRHASEVAFMHERWGKLLEHDPYLAHLPADIRRPASEPEGLRHLHQRLRSQLARVIGLT